MHTVTVAHAAVPDGESKESRLGIQSPEEKG